MHAGNIDNDTNEGRLYRFLRARSGYWFTTLDLIREVGVCNPATHKSGICRELQARGAHEEIQHRQEGRLHFYRHIYTTVEVAA